MVDSLLPLTLRDVSRSAGIDPFAATRLLVAMGSPPRSTLLFSSSDIESLVDFGRIDASWWGPEESTADFEGLVQMLLQMLLERGYIGYRATPLDNALRGLSGEQRGALVEAVDALVEEGLLHALPSPIGPLVAVTAAHEARVRRVANGQTSLATLQLLYEEHRGT